MVKLSDLNEINQLVNQFNQSDTLYQKWREEQVSAIAVTPDPGSKILSPYLDRCRELKGG